MAASPLTRSETDKVIGGVAGGISAHYGLDPTLVRVGFVIAAVFSGLGLLAYIVLWIVLPKGHISTPAIRIAEERFARGEITSEQLTQIRSDLEQSA
jgi:phage shock protein PspC (stress-responsive transcriptional regulator)